MRLVVGLGNPGTEYVDSRHNLGFRVVGELARRRGLTLSTAFCGSLVARSEGLLLAAPQTFMNRSGLAVRCLLEQEQIACEELLVVFDDLALPLGRLRLRAEGSPGGHRGLASILEQVRSREIPRLRLGVGAPPAEVDVADWVLKPFEREELEVVEQMVGRAADACEAWLTEALAVVASRFNAAPGAPVEIDAPPAD